MSVGNISSSETLVLKNELLEIKRFIEWFNLFVERYGVETSINRKVNAVMDDLISNVIFYAFSDTAEHEIEVRVTVDEERLSVCVTDSGVPFDPLGVEQLDTTLPIEKRDVGGLGIELIRRFSDSMDYKRIKDQNVLTVVFLRKKNKSAT